MQYQVKVQGQNAYTLMFTLYMGAIAYTVIDDWKIVTAITIAASVVYAIENKYLALFKEDRILYKRLFRRDVEILYKSISLARFKSYCFSLASTRLYLEYKNGDQAKNAYIKLQDVREEIEVGYILRQKNVPVG